MSTHLRIAQHLHNNSMKICTKSRITYLPGIELVSQLAAYKTHLPSAHVLDLGLTKLFHIRMQIRALFGASRVTSINL